MSQFKRMKRKERRGGRSLLSAAERLVEWVFMIYGQHHCMLDIELLFSGACYTLNLAE
jgi:hypothetical protein